MPEVKHELQELPGLADELERTLGPRREREAAAAPDAEFLERELEFLRQRDAAVSDDELVRRINGE